VIACMVATSPVSAQADPVPVVTVTGPTVIAFWRAPSSDEELVADPGLASALDQQQTYWADTYSRLQDLGVAALNQPGIRFRVQDGERERIFVASADSSDIGYLLVAPGRDFHVLYRLRFPDDLVAAAKSYFDLDRGAGHARVLDRESQSGGASRGALICAVTRRGEISSRLRAVPAPHLR
jgi:hypothetical protein